MIKTRECTLSDMHIRVEYGLVTIGDQRPYFSVTATYWNSKASARRWPDNPAGGGTAHQSILRAFPEMADIVALHLSDTDGVPMHADANSWYWYEEGNLDAASRLLRVAVADLPTNADRETFTAFVDAQRDRWASEAAATRSKYDLDNTMEDSEDDK